VLVLCGVVGGSEVGTVVGVVVVEETLLGVGVNRLTPAAPVTESVNHARGRG
jgi:hypothetical protein